MKSIKYVIAPYIEGAYYFYNVLDMAIFLSLDLAKKEKNYSINIYLYRMPFWINRISFLKIINIIGIKKNIHKNFDENKYKNSLFNNFLLRKEFIIWINGIQIKFNLINGQFYLLGWIKSFVFGFKNYIFLKRKSFINVEKLMKLKYEGIEIGTSVGSSCLRNDYKAHGSIQKCTNLLSSLIGAVYFIEYLKSQLKFMNIENVYVIPSERYFLHSLFVRTIRYLCGNILDGSDYNFEKSIVGPQHFYNYFDSVTNNIDSSLSDSDITIAKNYLNSRIYNPSKSLWYMFRGANDPNSKLKDTNGLEISTVDNELYVVVFLHQFEDGQYCFGYDGFDDVYDWTIFTINTLLANKNISKIFIKCHPNASSAKYPGDEIAIKNITNLFRKSPRVVWLDSSCGPLSLKNPGKFVGITKHGSIAEELASINIFNISSISSRWSNQYSFSKIWESKEDYKKILSSLSLEQKLLLNSNYMDDLYKFTRHYRLKSKNIHQRQSWYKYAWVIDGVKPTPLDFNKYNNKLSELKIESDESNKFINYLVKYNLSLT